MCSAARKNEERAKSMTLAPSSVNVSLAPNLMRPRVGGARLLARADYN
jgi:hypothetical protein